jgi:extradiol dioxygenase family protein
MRAMHRSRLAGFIIDCKDADLDAASRFWSEALGMPSGGAHDAYVTLDASSRDLDVEVQRVDHESRAHLDIESDDVDAEAARLEALGARRIGKVKTWWVMEAPTGHRFCVVRARRDISGVPGVNTW